MAIVGGALGTFTTMLREHVGETIVRGDAVRQSKKASKPEIPCMPERHDAESAIRATNDGVQREHKEFVETVTLVPDERRGSSSSASCWMTD